MKLDLNLIDYFFLNVHRETHSTETCRLITTATADAVFRNEAYFAEAIVGHAVVLIVRMKVRGGWSGAFSPKNTYFYPRKTNLFENGAQN